MAVRKFLDISTAHLKPQTMELINQYLMSDNTLIGHYGAMVHVPSEPDRNPNHAACPEILPILEMARTMDCDYVFFDADADIIEGLPDFSEEW